MSRITALAALLCVAAACATPKPRRPVTFEMHRIAEDRTEACGIGDLNGDGKLDIVAGAFWYEAPTWKQRRYRTLKGAVDNEGKGYMWDFVNIPLDVDVDGKNDIVSGSWFAKDCIWFKNVLPGEGPWPETVLYKDWQECETGEVWDIDGDGKKEEILIHTKTTFWVEAKGGKLVRHKVSDAEMNYGGGVGDVNGDGRPDIIRPDGWFEAPADPRAGEWKPHRIKLGSLEEGKSDHTSQIVVIDVNGDGRNDIIASAAHKYGLFWYEQLPGRDQWKQHVIDKSWSQVHSIAAVDLDDDGDLDLIAGKRFMAHNGHDPGAFEPLGVYWYELTPGPADQWKKHVISYDQGIGSGMNVAVADIDDDGDLDFVVIGKWGGPVLFENKMRE